jgi:hypothetical protein
MIELRVQRSGIHVAAIAIPMIGAALVQAVVDAGYNLVRQEAPMRSGELRRSVQQRSAGLEGEVTIGAPYAVFVASGTQPHVIRPVRAHALRFEVEGDVVFATRVQHPGTQSNPFVQRAAQRLVRLIPQIFERVWKRAESGT